MAQAAAGYLSLELEPDNPAYLDTLGWIYFMQGDVERALKEIQRAANLMPEDPTIVEHLGDVMDKTGKKDRAVGYWKRSFVLDPDVQRVRDRLTAAGVDLAPLVREAEARRAPAARSEKLRRLGDEVPAATPETE